MTARDSGAPAEAIANGAANLGVDESEAAVAYGVSKQILDAMPDDVRGDINESFGQLPDGEAAAVPLLVPCFLAPLVLPAKMGTSKASMHDYR